ncbi:UDP-N-acetylglucosamine 2-epimerase (non-hydrolyzing) [Candidatus Pacearchaeota archaeon]|jgi:UDP-N-acetylglucosamine 2-epimerase (non-hydrolysing)|nr:UDP-N-acetylglucosamine 2-epimerase (non-hydrolyzing) [Candidatus Pacearchaeota archaeon]
MIVFCIGGRPNIVKLYPFIEYFKKINFTNYKIIFTEQHYSNSMSQVFFDEFGFQPDYRLERSGKGHAHQTGSILIELEKLYFENLSLESFTDLFVVFGDMNSSLAGTLFAQKKDFPIAHVEAGLRVGRFDFPEEINRKLIDHMSTYNFVTEESGMINLKSETLANGHLVGNVLADSIRLHHTKWIDFNSKQYCLATFHRVENVDNGFRSILEILNNVADKIPVILSAHPRIKEVFMFDKRYLSKNIELVEPMSYSEFINKLCNASFVITDSGGVQCESYILHKPCITYNYHTPHKVTTLHGNNFVTEDQKTINDLVNKFLNLNILYYKINKLWDGHAVERIMEVLNKFL